MVALAKCLEDDNDQQMDYQDDDRRIFGRISLQLCVEARRMDHRISALRQPKMLLEVRDLSLNGLSGLSRQPVDPGERLTVFFPARPGMPAWDGFGRVVRCDPSSMGYRIAVEFESLPAA